MEVMNSLVAASIGNHLVSKQLLENEKLLLDSGLEYRDPTHRGKELVQSP